jgi:hypothetical protein
MPDRNSAQVFEKWNWNFHVYLGLYFVLFLWLFAISGLFMNHPKWFPHRPNRVSETRQVQVPADDSDMNRVHAVNHQLGLTGEPILWRNQPKPGAFAYRLVRPNRVIHVSVDLATGITQINTTLHVDKSGVLEILHTLSGVREIYNETVPSRDWVMTQIWSFSMDALSIGLIIMTLNSIYMWYRLKGEIVNGLIALALGIGSCVYFVWGLGLS